MELEGLITSIRKMGRMQILPKLFELFFIRTELMPSAN